MNRRLLGITAGACVVLLLAWNFLLWSPKGGELKAAKARTEAAAASASELQVRLARLKDADRRTPALTASLDRVKAAIPDSASLAQFILDADAASKEAGVDFLSIAPTPPAAPTDGGPTNVTLAMNITGGYFQVLDFTEKLLSLPRLVVIDTIQVAPSGASASGPPDLAVALSARMFTTQAPPALPGAAPAPAAGAPASPTATANTATVSAPPTTTVGASR